MEDITIKVVDNSAKVLQAFHTREGVIYNLIGEKVSKYTQNNTPVRTGRLRNSVDWQVSDDEKYVEVGFRAEDFKKTNKYAKYIEFGTSKTTGRHMLQRGIQEHKDEYKAIAKDILSKQL